MAKLFQFFILYISQLYFLSVNILYAYHLCPHDQSRSLLNFKDSLLIVDAKKAHCRDDTAFFSNTFLKDQLYLSSYCDENNFPIVDSKIDSWNGSTNCCVWEGVTCDEFTGNVIELDVSGSHLVGVIDSNSSLFQLSHLKRLNLAYNDLEGSRISPEFGRFTGLTHLNLSRSMFQGQISSTISHLNKLVSLDLSGNWKLILKRDVFHALLQNMTWLRELSLYSVYIISSVPNNLSSSLTIIDLSYTDLKGSFPYHIFHLPNLKQLSLADSSFDNYVSLASVKWNASSLTYLDLSYCRLTEVDFQSFGNLTHLSHLDLSSNDIFGQIPPEILSLEHLTWLNIGNNDLDSAIPHSASNKLTRLKVLSLGGTKFTASSIASFLNNLTELQTIDLSNNPLYEIPLELFELLSLQSIDLTSTQLHGPVPQSFSKLVNLKYLRLASNNLSGPMKMEPLFNLINLKYLKLNSNNFSGPIGIDALSNLVNLNYLNLASNNFEGPIEIDAFSNLVNLTTLDLSSNNLGGTLDVQFLTNFKGIASLDLSFSGLTLVNQNKTTMPMISIIDLRLASCNIRDLEVLRSFEVLLLLYLPSNNIHGELPEWVWSRWSNVGVLDLSKNFITHIGNKIPLEGLIALNLQSNLIRGHVPDLPYSLYVLSLSNNQFYGEIKSSICELNNVGILDLSNNSFSGALPQCIGMMSNELNVLDLHMNNLEGGIPGNLSLTSLKNINLRGNNFEGEIPRSLINCSFLEILDLSENNLNDTFPIWLGDLKFLRVLSLRSNKFYGPISSHHASSNAFTQLQILDLSYNQLSGSLPERIFQGLGGMRRVDETSTYYLGDNSPYTFILQHYYYSMRMVVNGNNMQLERIFKVMTAIDLSCNHFEGEIPNSIGNLIAVQHLNLSHNKFTGQIPRQLGKVSNLQSLDLSYNQFDDIIPGELADLGFLSVMNLSYNHLTGQIPYGRQLQTIPNDSYIGNNGLCGFPLSRKCGNNNPQIHVGVEDEGNHQELFDGFTWQSVVMGYGVGMLVGLVIGSLMLFTEKPKWLIRLVREEANRIIYKYKSRNGITWNTRS